MKISMDIYDMAQIVMLCGEYGQKTEHGRDTRKFGELCLDLSYEAHRDMERYIDREYKGYAIQMDEMANVLEEAYEYVTGITEG